MMFIQAENLGKRFKRNWVFRNLNFNVEPGSCLVLLGNNGSGKSTLAQLLLGYSSANEGSISFSIGNNSIPRENLALKSSFCAPYSELYEQLTLKECLTYHLQFRELSNRLSPESLIELAYLNGEENKQIQHFSSGMKQRLKLALSICTVSDLLILDEPCSNLDKQAIAWYRDLLGKFRNNRTLVIATNDIENDVLEQETVIKLSLNK